MQEGAFRSYAAQGGSYFSDFAISRSPAEMEPVPRPSNRVLTPILSSARRALGHKPGHLENLGNPGVTSPRFAKKRDIKLRLRTLRDISSGLRFAWADSVQ